ncbi:ATP-dependent helicase [Paenibacillus sp. 1011MAR3C5]|uniref:ATP-dependent helicase n=1 Tax=Paenibacillus sp. 1011MAR3C5 TaxID=1675787 RepID=UPI000E6B92AA|nr:ATP-dependent helicase [Paenibacillus sp. 1011MAR3C5]RJE85084.1 ATP-dependent helicase [Paenibacillus sp. 1011MAR3C5]
MGKLERFLERKLEELGVGLNEVQKQAVGQAEGPLLLLASPGSGKTTTLIMRIGYLIEELGADPARIKAVTFSRASARDMKERFTRFFPLLQPVDFSTIHSLAFEIVRTHFYKTRTAYDIIEGALEIEEGDEEQGYERPLPLHKRIILRNLFKDIVGENATDDAMEELTTYISYVKNKMLPPEQWASVKVDVPHAERILHEYESFKRSGTSKLLIDFDDMLTIAHDVLEKDGAMLRKLQSRYDYVMTDESQDTSMVQHAIIEKLVKSHRNLCVVADDDQSIYSWRGAEPTYLLRFKNVYPEAVTLYMVQNYRSSPEIVTTANTFIKRNKNRYDKEMFTNNASHQPITFKTLRDYREQAKYVVREIAKIEKLSEGAVLYRNNSSSIALMNEFDRAGIPFYMKDADNRFFSHWVIEDVLNFMRMSYTDKRADILENIHLKFNGYISKHQMSVLKSIDNGESVFDNLLTIAQLHDYQIKPLQEAKETFREMNGMPPLHAIRVIRTRLGYEKALEKLCERLGFRKEYLIGILNTLEDIAEGLETMADFAARLKYLEKVLKGAKSRKGQNAVTFSTFHSAKGLEFDHVYMVDLIEGVIPASEDGKKGAGGDSSSMEEAVRLFYVGMTRARRTLEMVTYGQRDGEQATESSFMSAVKDIVDPSRISARATAGSERQPILSAAGDSRSNSIRLKSTNFTSSREPVKAEANPNAAKHPTELAAGANVRHRVFGVGCIERADNESIIIRFGENNVKTLAMAMCIERGLLELV